jgi:hypothetical protein
LTGGNARRQESSSGCHRPLAASSISSVQIPFRRDEAGDGYRLEEITLEFESDRSLPLWLEAKLGTQSMTFEPNMNGTVRGVRVHATFPEPMSQGTVNYRFVLGPEYFVTAGRDPERPLNFRASLVTRHGIAQTEFDLELPQPAVENRDDSTSGSPVPVLDGPLTQQDAIVRAVEHLARPAPEVSGVRGPQNSVAWSMTLGDYERRTGQASSLDPDIPVWVVHVAGESHSAGAVPSEARQTYRFAVAVLDARTGSVVATQRMNEPLGWPTVTDAPTMSDPNRLGSALGFFGSGEAPMPTPDPGRTPAPAPPVSWLCAETRGTFLEVGGERIPLHERLCVQSIDPEYGARVQVASGRSWVSVNPETGKQTGGVDVLGGS